MRASCLKGWDLKGCPVEEGHGEFRREQFVS